MIRKGIWACLSLIGLSIFGCSGSGSSTGDGRTQTVSVYIKTGEKQCEPTSGLSASESKKTLTDSGVSVVETQCGSQTGMVFISVCGAGTADIVIHTILANEEAKALSLGYLSVKSLMKGTSLGFVTKECQ